MNRFPATLKSVNKARGECAGFILDGGFTMDLQKEAERIGDLFDKYDVFLSADMYDEIFQIVRAVHDEALEKAALLCHARELDEEFHAQRSRYQSRGQAIAMADCAGELKEQIRTLKIGDAQ